MRASIQHAAATLPNRRTSDPSVSGACVLEGAFLCVQSKRISLATGGAAIPGAIPDTMDALLDSQELATQQAVTLAEKFATNVAPAVVPEAAGRARLADLQADLAQCCLTFLSAHSALVALSNGRLLQLSLQVHMTMPRLLLAMVLALTFVGEPATIQLEPDRLSCSTLCGIEAQLSPIPVISRG